MFDINPAGNQYPLPDELVETETKELQISNNSKDVRCVLLIKPKVQGFLRVSGITWDLMGLPIKYFFDLKGKKNKDGQTFEDNLKNCFEIVANTTKMTYAVENYEENVYYGEIRPFYLVLKNEGIDRIDKVLISTSASHIFGFNQLNLAINLEPGQETKVFTINTNLHI